MFPTAGLNYILNVLFGATAKPTDLYIGLVASSGFTGFSDSDTAASHTGWTEFEDYDESGRVEITFGAASDSSIVNPTSISFTPNDNATVYGWFLSTAAGKGATTGTLICMSAFAEGPVEVQSGIVQSFTLTINDRNI